MGCLIYLAVSVPRERLLGCSILPQAFLLPRRTCTIDIHLLPGGRFLRSSPKRSTTDVSRASATKRWAFCGSIFHSIPKRNPGTSHDFSKTHAEVRMIPALPSSHPLPLHRLSPSHSNVRVQPAPDALFSITNPSTPIYNTAILLSTFPKLSLLSTNALIQSSQAFRDAHTLLRVWANQRGYGEGALCIHGFEGKGSWWASVLGFLLDGEEPVSVLGKGVVGRRRFIGKGLSSYQLFRASLDLLGKILVLASYILLMSVVSAKQEFENAPAFVKFTNGHKVSENLILQVDAMLITIHLVFARRILVQSLCCLCRRNLYHKPLGRCSFDFS